MAEDTEQSTPEANAADGGKSSSFVDKAKDFFTMGGDKKKWTKALIVTAFVIVFMGMGNAAVWGAAISFYIKSIGEPNGGNLGGVGDNFVVIKTMDVYVTMYSPHVESGGIDNDCDAGQGGGNGGEYASGADGSTFRLVNGKFQIKLPDKRIVDHVFAESQDNQKKPYRSDNIIDWDKRNQQAIQIPGVLGGVPIEVHDVYGDVHQGTGNNNFLDLSYTCGPEANELVNQLKAAQKAQGMSGEKEGGILLKVNIVEKGGIGPVDINNLASWYYNQGSDKSRGGGSWGGKHAMCSSVWSSDQTFASAGCGITSMAMIARYFGKNIDPYQMGQQFCSNAGSMNVGDSTIKDVAKKTLGMKAVHVPNPSAEQIISLIQQGHAPMILYGFHVFDSSRYHFVVVAGYDGTNFIINDPSRGSARHVPPANKGSQSELWYFTK